VKKFLLLLLLLSAAAVPAVPYYIGTTVEQNFRAEHAEAALEAARSGVTIELVDYQRQLFNATATTRITLPDPESKEDITLEFTHRIDHTPHPASQVIASVETTLLLSDEVTATLEPLLQGKAPFDVQTRIFLDGHQEGTLHSPAVSGPLAGDENTRVEWMGLQGSVWQSAGRDKVTLSMTMPKLSFNAAGDNSAMPGVPRTINFSDMSYVTEMHKGASGMWQGSAKILIGSIAASGTDEGGSELDLSIDGLDLQGEQSETNGLVAAGGVFKSRHINVNGFELTDARYDLNVENLEAGALMALQEEMQKVAQTKTEPADPLQPLRAHLPALFNAQPVFKINDMSVNSPMGRFALKLDARITGQWSDAILENPALLATLFKADIDASVPRAIVTSTLQDNVRNAIIAQAAANEMELSDEELENAVEQTVSHQLEGLITQGYIKANEEQLESQLQYNAGQLTINGMDASPLIGALML
jgi:uncharacterized protein YdgA (DUF945 family)